MTVAHVASPAWESANPTLSVLVPFFGDDPRPLVVALGARQDVEILLYEDGPSPIGDELCSELSDARGAIRLLRGFRNRGRAAARNALVQAARADRLLLLDADMLPNRPEFLPRWVELKDTPVAFGGLSLQSTPKNAATALHHFMTKRRYVVPVEARRRDPVRHLYASNVLVHREIAHAIPFDEGFCGWGWEDVEWAHRVSERWPIHHIDNPTSHLALHEAGVLLARFEASAPNFARFVARHPGAAGKLPSFRAARMLRRIGDRSALRSGLRRAALSERVPVPLRDAAIRAYRASVYADVLGDWAP